jgi:hypothetical protein
MAIIQDIYLPLVLNSTGYGGTGSSARTDILREFATVKNFGENEYTLFIYTNLSQGIDTLKLL